MPFDDLIQEVKKLGNVRELILVAQDTTKYGEDLTPKKSLTELIRSLSALPNIMGIRLLYCYPENITDELIHEMQVNAKMIRYIDIPFQHASDSVLHRMNRTHHYSNICNAKLNTIFFVALYILLCASLPFFTMPHKAHSNVLHFLWCRP